MPLVLCQKKSLLVFKSDTTPACAPYSAVLGAYRRRRAAIVLEAPHLAGFALGQGTWRD